MGRQLEIEKHEFDKIRREGFNVTLSTFQKDKKGKSVYFINL